MGTETDMGLRKKQHGHRNRPGLKKQTVFAQKQTRAEETDGMGTETDQGLRNRQYGHRNRQVLKKRTAWAPLQNRPGLKKRLWAQKQTRAEETDSMGTETD